MVKCEIFHILDLFNFINGWSKIQNGEETSTYESVLKSIRSDPSINELLTRTIDTYESIIKLTKSDTIINDLLTRVIAGKAMKSSPLFRPFCGSESKLFFQ